MKSWRFRLPRRRRSARTAHGQRHSPLGRPLQLERLEDRRLLTIDTWIGGSGDWSNSADWSAGVPTSKADVTISTTSPVTVSILPGDVESVGSLTIGPGDSLSMTGGSLTTTSYLQNGGAITVAAGCDLTVGGSFSQAGSATLSLPGGGLLDVPATNLAANSDFESPAAGAGTTPPSGWSTFGTAALSTQYAYTGSQSLDMSGADSAAYQLFAATPGTSYTVSTDAMTPASDPLTGNEVGSLQLLFFNSAGTLLSSYVAPNSVGVLNSSSPTGGPLAGSVGGQGWNHFYTSAVAPAGTATAEAVLTTGSDSGSGGGSVFWDDAQFGPSVPGASAFSAGSISNGGTITVGPSNTVSTSGNFTQTSTGTLDIQLGGAPSTGAFGLVNVAGAATLAGTLKSDLVYGYTPSTTDSFTPMEFASESGTFANDSLPSSSSYRFAGAVTFTNVVVSAAPVAAVTSTIAANTSVNADTTNLLGVNLGYWDDQLPTSQTQQMVTAAGVTLYRFPGGSASDDFHFNQSDNLGDSVANTIPQFAQFISSVGGTGLVTVDYGSGSPQEAAAELAYLEGSPSDTTVIGSGLEWNDSTNQWQSVNWETVGYWASLRAASPLATDDGLNFLRIDHSAPFANIPDWEIGNEEYGSYETDHHGTAGPGGASTGSAHDPATYAAFCATFSTLAAEITSKAGLPAISIGIDSEDPTGRDDNDWTKNVLADGLSLGFVPGFISDHSYMQAPGSESDSGLLDDTVSDPSSILDWSTRHADYESLLQQTLGARASSVSVMATEFNSVSTDPGKQTTSLVNGLFIANSIGSLLDSGYDAGIVWDLRNGWQTGNNNSNLLYGWREGGDYGQLGEDTDSDAPDTGPYIAYPGYYALQLASKIDLAGGEVVSATSNYGDLDVYAVKQANGHLELLVVNTNAAASLTDQFNVTGFQPGTSALAWQYGEAQDTAQSQSTNGASALANFIAPLNVSGTGFSYTFPAYSMTVLNLAPITVTPSGTRANYTVGAAPVAVDAGVTVTSSTTDLTGATVAISAATLQSGDSLSFTSPTGSGISGVYAGGVLTLSGTSTVANYQAALQSVEFSSTSTTTSVRSLSIVADDAALTSNSVPESVNVGPVTLAGPKVTSTTTTENLQTTSGLVITPGAGDTTAAYFQIYGITGGTLYQNNGTTPIANNSYIPVAQGEAGLKFTPKAGSLAAGGFTARESTTAGAAGLGGPTVRAAITVTMAGPTVTRATTSENSQSTSGLVITPGAADSSAAYFQIYGITGGTLYQNDGTTPIANNSYIPLAQGEAGLKFAPNAGSLVPGGFTARESATAGAAGLSGPTARAAITVTLAGPTVTGVTTTENVQTTSGLVITPGAGDNSAAYFQIYGITGGTLYQNNGTTPIANNSFIPVAQGEAGLRFSPNAGTLVAGGFTARESATAGAGGLSGPTSRAAVAVTLAGPSVANATTMEDTQASGLVITPGAGDSSAAYFQIYGITGGTLYQTDGTTPIANNSFIPLAQGEAGLAFTPNAGSLVPGGFTIRESTTAGAAGLSGPTARAAITVNAPFSMVLAVQEIGISQSSTAGSVIPATSFIPATSVIPASASQTTPTTGTSNSGSESTASTKTESVRQGRHPLALSDEQRRAASSEQRRAATDAAVSAFDLAEVWA